MLLIDVLPNTIYAREAFFAYVTSRYGLAGDLRAIRLSLGNGNDDVDLGGEGRGWGAHSGTINVTGETLVQLGTGTKTTLTHTT